MNFGVPKEVRDLEKRVGLTPVGVRTLVQAGHTVYVERDAGIGAGFPDEVYREAGAQIVYSAAEAYGRADTVAKVTRPTAAEHSLFRPGQAIFSFLHLPVASPDLYDALVKYNITAIAYELIQEPDGTLPVLIPASEIAGRLAPVIAGHLLMQSYGRGVLLGGVPGVPPAVVVILGGGGLGINAARAFAGAGAEVIVLDWDMRRLRRVDELMGSRVTTMFATEYNLRRTALFADVLVGAVSSPGERAPILVDEDTVRRMRTGTVIMDFSIDSGGCTATSRPTNLRNPTYIYGGVIHYCVPNVTAAVARSASHAFTNGAIPYLLTVGEHGMVGVLAKDAALLQGIVMYQGQLVHPTIARALGRDVEVNLSRGGHA